MLIKYFYPNKNSIGNTVIETSNYIIGKCQGDK